MPPSPSMPFHPLIRSRILLRLLVPAVLLVPLGLSAQNIYLDEGDTEKEPTSFLLPYIFSTESLGVAGGVVAIASGAGQPQTFLGGAVLGSSNGSYGAYFKGIGIQAPFAQRLVFDPLVTLGRYAEMRSYQDGNPFYLGERAGSNDSDENDFLEGKGWDYRVDLELDYILPIGNGRKGPIHTYHLHDGLLANEEEASGGTAFNPLTSGRTYLRFSPYYWVRDYDRNQGRLHTNSNGLEFGLIWNNVDFEASPERGEIISLLAKRDFGWINSDNSFLTWEAEFSKFFSLGETSFARQQVLAFDLWTANTPTWDDNPDGTISNRAPDFLSPSLGGWERFRSAPFYRFNGKSAIHYTAEYRVIPQWNPFRQVGWLQWADRWLDIDWWQVVLFAEAGRVAPKWDLSELHKDINFDGGIGLRFMAHKSVVRFDVAAGEESVGVWFYLGQSF